MKKKSLNTPLKIRSKCVRTSVRISATMSHICVKIMQNQIISRTNNYYQKSTGSTPIRNGFSKTSSTADFRSKTHKNEGMPIRILEVIMWQLG